MICYARNFEDVILQRVFAGVPDGCFLDVGASMPIGENNTYALYQKGWRGVALEPLPLQQVSLEARPEDVFLNAAVGEKIGILDAAGIRRSVADIRRSLRDHDALATQRQATQPQRGGADGDS